MNINATIILQAINFGIAYFLFRSILLKAAYAAIVADNQKKDHLENLVADDKDRIDQDKQELTDQRRTSYFFFKKHMPHAVHATILDRKSLPSIQVHSIEKKQLDSMKERVSKDIIAAIGAYNDNR